jgi:hypothetical protein
MPFYPYLIPLKVFFKIINFLHISKCYIKKTMIRKGGIILESYFVFKLVHALLLKEKKYFDI